MILPSIELFNKVTGVEITFITQKNESELNFYIPNTGYMNGSTSSINIYELQHLMKEWAGNIQNFKYPHMEAYSIQSYIRQDTAFNAEVNSLYHPNITYIVKDAFTEPEAVTKACEWILKQTEV